MAQNKDNMDLKGLLLQCMGIADTLMISNNPYHFRS